MSTLCQIVARIDSRQSRLGNEQGTHVCVVRAAERLALWSYHQTLPPIPFSSSRFQRIPPHIDASFPIVSHCLVTAQTTPSPNSRSALQCIPPHIDSSCPIAPYCSVTRGTAPSCLIGLSAASCMRVALLQQHSLAAQVQIATTDVDDLLERHGRDINRVGADRPATNENPHR